LGGRKGIRPVKKSGGVLVWLFKKSSNRNIRTTFFCERVINAWNKLPADTDFSSLSKFKRNITSVPSVL